MMRFLYIAILMLTIGCESNTCNPELISNDDDSSVEETNNDVSWTECGHQLGEHPCDFSLVDVNGDTFNLYDHIGEVIVIDFSTMWCYYCQVAGAKAQEFQDTYGQHDFVYVTILIEDSYGGTVEQSDLELWADEFGITSAPLLAGSRDLVDLSATEGYPITGWPTFVLINRDMVLEHGMNGWSESAVITWIEDAIQ